jgi:hypothetical protein
LASNFRNGGAEGDNILVRPAVPGNRYLPQCTSVKDLLSVVGGGASGDGRNKLVCPDRQADFRGEELPFPIA